MQSFIGILQVVCEKKAACTQTLTQFLSPKRGIILSKYSQELWDLCIPHHKVMENIHANFHWIPASSLWEKGSLLKTLTQLSTSAEDADDADTGVMTLAPPHIRYGSLKRKSKEDCVGLQKRSVSLNFWNTISHNSYSNPMLWVLI